jgi:hypothetical protein
MTGCVECIPTVGRDVALVLKGNNVAMNTFYIVD